MLNKHFTSVTTTCFFLPFEVLTTLYAGALSMISLLKSMNPAFHYHFAWYFPASFLKDEIFVF